MTSDNLFQSPFGKLRLQRYPIPAPSGREQSLRAWDAADEYLLEELGSDAAAVGGTIAIVNDGFGALTCSLNGRSSAPLLMLGDSFLSQEACRRNLALNQLDASQVMMLDCQQPLPCPAIDLVLLKIPRSLALLEAQLEHLRPGLHAGTRIIAAGMVKHMPASTQTVFEHVLGPARTSLARKKARLLFCDPAPAQWPATAPAPLTDSYVVEWDGRDITLHNHAGVFSREGLDIGTRLLLEHLPVTISGRQVIDLGCGNGLVGIAAALRYPDAELHFTDESFNALASARLNMAAALPGRAATFTATNCLDGIGNNSADLILNNPPFHQQHVVGDHVAWQMFKDARRVLRSGGELWVVGNRHMGYHAKLERLFGHCELVASNSKFVVLRARKSV